MRILILALALSACACSTAPVVNAQPQIEALKADYALAFAAERKYSALGPCAWTPPPCSDARTVFRIKQADYNASAAIVTADSERTADAMAKARDAVSVFAEAISEIN